MNRKCKIIVSFMVITLASKTLLSQPHAIPVLPEQHGSNGNYSTNGAPVGEGSGIMITLGLVYLAVLVGKRRPDQDLEERE